jgi:GNAT superfamily N-acetyltransferase
VIVEPLAVPAGRGVPAPLLTEITALYAANRDFHALSGDFPDPGDIRPEQVASALAEESADPDVEVLLARAEGRLAGIAITLARHPDPAYPDPWIGLLMVDPGVQRRGYGREFATAVEERFRAAGRTGVRLAVLDANPRGLAFWTALGYEVIDHRPDRRLGRSCAVLRKPLPQPRTPRRATRTGPARPADERERQGVSERPVPPSSAG